MRAGSRLSCFALVVLTQVACGGGGGTADPVTGGDDTGATTTETGGGDDTGLSTADSSATDSSGGDSTSTGDSISTGDSTPTMDTTPPGDGAACAPASCGADTDCDGISDTIEGRFAAGGATDTDGDGIADYKDDDSDGDGIPDRLEWVKSGCDSPIDDANDADGDGLPNFQDTDSDGNGLDDKDEVCPPADVLTKLAKPACSPTKPYDFDGDGVADYLDFDNDHDSAKTDKALGLPDKIELSDNTGKYVGRVDTDGDGVPDLYDIDSDNDFILDLEDGTSDDDGDKLPAFRDTDTDGDGVPDKCEGHNKSAPTSSDALLPVLDTDGDGLPDFRDLDSDEDYLADGKEDLNGDCIIDAAETDRTKADTDGDGVGDLPEVVLLGAAGAKDKTATPAKAGKFFFVVPYSVDGSKKPTPDKGTLALSTNLKQGDVAFVVDTTFSMEEEIKELRDSLSTKIIPELSKRFADLGIGVAAHEDFPTASEMLAGGASLPFYLPTGGTVTTVAATSQAAAASLVTRPGGPLPESQVAAMMRALTGEALTWPEGVLAAITPPAGTFGAMRFRTGSLPILVPITDAAMHNGRRAKNTTPTGVAADYETTYHHLYPFASPNIDNLVAKINELGAKVIGVASADIERTAQLTNQYMPYSDLAYLSDKTGSYVPRSAFTGGTFSGCKTGFGGTAISEYTDGPGDSCRLVFSVGTNGAGLGNAIVEGVGALLNAIAFDVYVRAYKDPAGSTTVDAVDAFITSIEPLPSGGTDPVTGVICTTFSASTLKDKYNTPKAVTGAGDIKETIGGLNPGKLYCFQLNPKPNTTVIPKTTPQEFKAFLSVVADKPSGGSISLGTDREVLFIVPPTLN